jgi:filamentous hemagglutinin family protein
MNISSPRRHAPRCIARRAARTARPQTLPCSLVRALTACSLLTFWPGAAELRAQALPTGMNVVAGQAAARSMGNTLTVNNTPNAIINWNTFSIGAGNAVRFDQASASSQVLNRVTGNDPSAILGSLSSNGRVWLLNPNGVLFGQGARIDVASFVTSTLNLNNADWLAGHYQFTQGSGNPAGIVNQGELRSSLGGRVALIGGNVRNEGEINAPGGQVVLAAGSSVELLDSATPNVSVKLNASAGEVVNLGRLIAAGGRIDVQAATVNQNGIVRADSLSTGPGGEVVLMGRDQLNLDAGSQTTANGGSGGMITLQADQTMVRGEVAATGSQASGGQAKLLGRQVGLLDAARVDVSGAGGGGEVLVGGGPQGKDPNVPNAQAVYFGPQAGISADAVGSGDGGHVVLWSDQATRAYGSLSARGGAAGGRGGLIETSGGWLDARPSKVDLGAPKGSAGLWLLDPFDVTINDTGPDTGYDPVTFTANASGSTISTAVIKGQLDAGNSVTISTGGGLGPEAGNIGMTNATLNVTGISPGSLTLIADASIALTGSTIQSASPMNVSLQASRGGDGGITLQNSHIDSGTGNISLGGFGTGIGISGAFGNAAFSNSNYGVLISNSTLNAGTALISGNLSIAGASGSLAGVSVSNGSALSARNITINGSSSGAANGVEVTGANLTSPGAISVQGVGAQSGVVLSAGSSMLSSPGASGSSQLGLVGLSTGNANGVLVAGNLTGGNGNSVSVSGGNTGGPNPAVLVTGNITVDTTPAQLTLGIINPAIDNSIVVNGSTLTGSGGILIFGASSLTLLNTTATSNHAIQLQADNIDFEGATSLASGQPTGDVFVLSNRNNGPLSSFTNNSTIGTGGSGALQSQAPARWIIWASDIASTSFKPGALPYDFTLYGAADPTAWSTFTGNGYASASTGVSIVTGTIPSRVYDSTQTVVLQGSLQATGPRGEVGNLVIPPALQFADKNVGTAKPVQLVGSYEVDFTDSLGKPAFGLGTSLQSGMTGDITPATIPLQGLTGNAKVYDSTTVATYTGTPSITPLGSDVVSVLLPAGAPAFFADKNVGFKNISIPSMTLTGPDAGNYVLITPGFGASIVQFQVSPIVSVNNKVYDATTAATFASPPTAAFFPGDDVALAGGTPTFINKDVGTNLVQVTGLTLIGADAGNYRRSITVNTTATITPATLTVNGLTAASKVYDATTAATLSGTPSVTPLGSDNVFLAGTAAGNFADKNVGTAKPVSVSGLIPAGPDGHNYVLAAPAGLTADITPATLLVTGLTANNKVYDATVAATLSGTGSATPLGNDLVAVSSSPVGTFSDKNVGTAKTVSISASSLTGPDAGNYTPTASGLRADITPAALVVGGLTANSKVYDATTAATLSGTATVAALANDVVSVSGSPLAQFPDKNVGSAKNVAVSGYTLAGLDAGNYTIVQPSGLTADITPATLRYIATPVTQLVGLAIQPLDGTVEGFVGGETQQSVTSGTLAFTTPATRTSLPGSYTILGSGLGAPNYVFVQDPANSTALTLNAPSTTDAVITKKISDGTPTKALQLMARPEPPPDPAMGGVVDLVTVVSTPSTTSPTASQVTASTQSSFGPVTLSEMSSEALVGMLDARAQYKNLVFADALEQLQKDPTLADMPPCRSRDEMLRGRCVVTQALKRQLQSAQAPATATIPAPAAPAAAAPAVTPPAPPGTPTAPSVAATAPAVSATAPAAAAAPSTAATLARLLAEPRRVLDASLPQIHRKVAVVIGVDRYDDPTIPQLGNAVGDARAIGNVLESQMGYETVVLENPTRQSVVAALNGLAVDLGPKDSVILYYAGHGELVESTKLGYWLLADSDANRPETWLSNADIGRMVAQIEASQVALISDSCYSGSLVTDQRIRAEVGAVDPAQLLSRRSVVVMSSGGNEPVADAGKEGHSPFAWNLMNNLRQVSAWQPGGNLFERVRFAVAKELPQRPQYAAFSAGGHQAGGDYLFEQRKLEPEPQ